MPYREDLQIITFLNGQIFKYYYVIKFKSMPSYSYWTKEPNFTTLSVISIHKIPRQMIIKITSNSHFERDFQQPNRLNAIKRKIGHLQRQKMGKMNESGRGKRIWRRVQLEPSFSLMATTDLGLKRGKCQNQRRMFRDPLQLRLKRSPHRLSAAVGVDHFSASNFFGKKWVKNHFSSWTFNNLVTVHEIRFVTI